MADLLRIVKTGWSDQEFRFSILDFRFETKWILHWLYRTILCIKWWPRKFLGWNSQVESLECRYEWFISTFQLATNKFRGQENLIKSFKLMLDCAGLSDIKPVIGVQSFSKCFRTFLSTYQFQFKTLKWFQKTLAKKFLGLEILALRKRPQKRNKLKEI